MVKRSRQIIWGLLVVPLVAGLGLIELRAINRVNSPIADSPTTIINNIYCACNHLGLRCGELAIAGTGFGDSRIYVSGGKQIARMVVIDGTPLIDGNVYFQWSDTYIGVLLQQTPIPILVDHLYQVTIAHMPFPATNANIAIDTPAFPFRYLIRWAPDYPPQSGAPGHVAREIGCGIYSPQGDLVLMMGSTPVTDVISWGTNVGRVDFRVPNLPAGSYELWIKKGIKSVSDKKPFTVNNPS